MEEMIRMQRRPGGIEVSGRFVAAIDQAYMRRALELAALGRGKTHPNPMVGCVIVKDGRIIGEGFHEGAGNPHAEVVAVSNAGGPAAVVGATVYVNLEPCVHHGRTPPCVDLLIKCRPREVVIGHLDPDPRVAGKGVAKLREAGIPVIEGVCRQEAEELNEAWLTWITKQRPFIALKYAMTLDGKIASRSGHSQWITGPAARRHAHMLRNRYDAILVGVGTVLADDPQLTCRLDDGRDPIRIVLDTSARTPPGARVINRESTAPTWIMVSDTADPGRVAALVEAGAKVWRLPQRDGVLDIRELLDFLAAQQVVSVLVEGGPRVHRSFLENDAYDKMYVYIGAKTVGGDDAPGPVAGNAAEHMSLASNWTIRKCQPLAGDVCCEAYRSA